MVASDFGEPERTDFDFVAGERGEFFAVGVFGAETFFFEAVSDVSGGFVSVPIDEGEGETGRGDGVAGGEVGFCVGRVGEIAVEIVGVVPRVEPCGYCAFSGFDDCGLEAADRAGVCAF